MGSKAKTPEGRLSSDWPARAGLWRACHRSLRQRLLRSARGRRLRRRWRRTRRPAPAWFPAGHRPTVSECFARLLGRWTQVQRQRAHVEFQHAADVLSDADRPVRLVTGIGRSSRWLQSRCEACPKLVMDRLKPGPSTAKFLAVRQPVQAPCSAMPGRRRRNPKSYQFVMTTKARLGHLVGLFCRFGTRPPLSHR